MANVEELIFRNMDTNGDGTGTKNANGNYGTPDDFYFQSPYAVELHRMIIPIGDTAGMTAEEYGNLGAALTNGWELKVKTAADVVKLDLTDGIPIKSNAEVGRVCFDVDLKDFGTTPTNEILLARWTFTRCGSPLILDPLDKLVITFSDNLTGLLTHYFMVQGLRLV